MSELQIILFMCCVDIFSIIFYALDLRIEVKGKFVAILHLVCIFGWFVNWGVKKIHKCNP